MLAAIVVAVLVVLLLVCVVCVIIQIRKNKQPEPLFLEPEPTETDASYDALAADYRRRVIEAGYALPPSMLGSRDGHELLPLNPQRGSTMKATNRIAFRSTLTDTVIGQVPHKRMNLGGVSFHAPVALETIQQPDGSRRIKQNSASLPYPRMADKDRYLYVLPGGSVTV